MSTEHDRETRQARLQTDVTHLFDLGETVQRLRSEPEYAANGRNGTTLVKNADLRVVLEAVSAGGGLPEHHAPGPITVQVLEGELAFTVAGETYSLRPGQLLTVPSRVPHSLQAAQDTVFLLTIAPANASPP